MNTSNNYVYVGSEIGALRRVLLHRPGKELKNVTIDNKNELLIDEIVWVERARRDHDDFAALLADNGVEVVYFQDCLADVLKEPDIRRNLLDDLMMFETRDKNLAASLRDAVMEMSAEEAAETLIGGMTKGEAANLLGNIKSLAFVSAKDRAFLFYPLPNLYFQRDPYFFVKNAVALCAMRYPARRREPLFARYIFQYHHLFKNVKIIFGGEQKDRYPNIIEGGDFLVLNENCVAIGMSERSMAGTIQNVAGRLASEIGIGKVLAVDIPKQRAYMHLDTVFTMVDRDAFTIYPGIAGNIRIWELTCDEGGNIVDLTETSDLFGCLKKNLGLEKIRCIETGGGDLTAASRDQWNDGTNTLAIAPGVVVTYEINEASNRALRDSGIKVFEINGAELGKGRGGPRCMSMPLKRG
jgi:arginine deiminase